MSTIETLEKGVKMLKLNNKNTRTTSSPSRENAGSKLILKDLIKELNMINANDTVLRDIFRTLANIKDEAFSKIVNG